jgi:hypothetical protein
MEDIMEGLEDVLVPILVPIATFAMIVLIVWLAHLSRKHLIHEQAELRRRLLDKFNSGQELTQFLATPQGQSFIKELEIGGRMRSAKHRILGSIKTGIVLLLLGAGFLVLQRYISGRHEFEVIIPAVILLALGVAFLIAAGVSYWLSKKWGIFEESAVVSQK